ncbi:MAG: glutamine synthetase [Clostridia bacterium]|nr:glutamine synthetase [Clostridia bacterium]
MKYTKQEVIQFIDEEDVKFIRLAFCDVFGTQKNISILPEELGKAFEYGIAIDAWSIPGFEDDKRSDLFLHPDPATLVVLPWRPEHGRVVRMFCDITWPDGKPFHGDARYILKESVKTAAHADCRFSFGSETEFYLFKRDDDGNPTQEPYDEAGYLDIAPADKGENVRREICLTLEQMGIVPQTSHHEEGPGQNEIVFRHSDPLTAADNAITFRGVVQTVANRNGLVADFSPKPLDSRPGNGMHINFSVSSGAHFAPLVPAIAGVLNRICDMTLFLNPTDRSYLRLGREKAPSYISWSAENRSQLIRIPAAFGASKRAELRSADPTANPYIAFSLLIHAAIKGIANDEQLPPVADFNIYSAPQEVLDNFKKLPESLAEARRIASESEFIRNCLPSTIINSYLH